MVKQHAHAMLTNDRLGLFHWSGAFQSQWRTKSISSTSQSSWGAARPTFKRARIHMYSYNKHSESRQQGIFLAYTNCCGDWRVQTETHTKPQSYLYSNYPPTVLQTSLLLSELIVQHHLQWFMMGYFSFWKQSYCGWRLISIKKHHVHLNHTSTSSCDGVQVTRNEPTETFVYTWESAESKSFPGLMT